MKFTTVGEINEYRSESINPLLEPDTVFEVYSVPIYDTGHPEYLSGKEIGSTKQIVQKDDILLCKINPRINRVWIVSDESDQRNIASSEWIVIRNHSYNPQYLAWYFRSEVFKSLMISEVTGIGGSLTRAQPKRVATYPVPVLDRHEQDGIVDRLNRLHSVIQYRMMQLQKLDELVKARFVEMFGDFKTNPKGWPIVGFEEIATIDGNMTTDYERYADYPHIGIDSIEKDTGILRGYRTVAEDGVISGKYVFTPEHIIYSKIRPNLNKVALPDFVGLCSADAYPILPIPGKCNRVFLAYNMRSTFFLDYILQFCNRTNLPKVNRKEVSGFRTPLPPLALQNEFATFVSQVDKSKLSIQASLDQFETLKQSLMQKYFE